MAKEYRHIGKETPSLAAREFVTGKAKYIRDMKRPHMLYGKVLRSPYPHANIKSIDTSKAEKLPGVKAVLTYKNAPDWISGITYTSRTCPRQQGAFRRGCCSSGCRRDRGNR